ncbi:MAG: TIGR03790 family protein [Thiobacillaceae bacterium]
MKRTARPLGFMLLSWLMLGSAPALAQLTEAVVVSFSKPGLAADQLGVIVNDDDPDSVAIAAYYKEKRDIPDANMIHVRFAPNRATLPAAEFAKIKRRVDRAAGKKIQAYALTWAQPYRVDCMSITAAFAFGFNPAYCASGCQPIKPSPYFNSSTSLPYDTYKIRPSMSLAASTVDQAKKLIDRGVESDNKNPDGTAYLVSTSDVQRNVRAAGYAQAQTLLNKVLPSEIVKANQIENKRDVMFYFTGLTHVPKIENNTYLPGAMADHLTSTGGVLFDGDQMSILKWIEAGATGSYGAVVEPCNFPQKFPVPMLAMAHYLQGETLIEAYWKSVQMPGQGLFIGEPLARPYGGYTSTYHDQELRIQTAAIEPGVYAMQTAPSMMGPYRNIARLQIGWGSKEIKLSPIPPGYYRFERKTGGRAAP